MSNHYVVQVLSGIDLLTEVAADLQGRGVKTEAFTAGSGRRSLTVEPHESEQALDAIRRVYMPRTRSGPYCGDHLAILHCWDEGNGTEDVVIVVGGGRTMQIR